MKNFRYLIPLLGLLFAFACSPEEKNLFDDSAANRIDAALKHTQDILKGAENGWKMEYFPSAQQTFGGFTILASFTDTDVQVASDYRLFDTSKKSTYSLKQSAGPVLSFDTYNEVFHIFSDPNSSVSGKGTNGKGMEGDFEFLVIKATQDSVILKGKKTANKIVMTPLAKDLVWNDYLEDLTDAYKTMKFPKFEYVVNGETIPVSVKERTLTFTYTENEQLVSKTASYIQTLEGYKFYQPFTIKGVTITEFEYNADGGAGYFTVKGNNDIVINPIIPPLNEQLVSGNWYFKYSTLGPLGVLRWDFVKNNGLANEGETLYYAYLGKDSSGKFAFNFASNPNGTSSLFGGSLSFNHTLTDENTISLVYAIAGTGNGVWYYNNANFNDYVDVLGLSATKTFTLTADNLAEPSWIKFSDNANANNYFTVYKDEVIWPYDK